MVDIRKSGGKRGCSGARCVLRSCGGVCIVFCGEEVGDFDKEMDLGIFSARL